MKMLVKLTVLEMAERAEVRGGDGRSGCHPWVASEKVAASDMGIWFGS